jgi:hypothetical protein
MDSSSSEHEHRAGFRLGRRLGADVWEAVQPGLERVVALRRLPPGTRVDAAAWPERPGVVPLFAVAEDPSGVYVATRLLPGARTLTELRSAPAARRRRWLDQAAAAVHGAVHGRLSEHDVLVDADGRAWVTGFGRAPADATAHDDRDALALMRPAASRRRWVATAAAVVPVVTIAVVFALRAGGDGAPAPAPPVTAGASAFGSALAPGEVATVDCEGGAPGGASPACTIMQAALPGRALVATSAGLVRGWAARGVRGRVALQVIVPRGSGFVVYNRGPMVTVDDTGAPRLIAADMSVPKGARFAIEVAPGAAVGIRRGVPGAGTARFLGPLRSAVRPARAAGGEGQELLLRVDVVPRG